MLLRMLSLFADMPHSQRLSLFLLACTFPEAETRHFKVQNLLPDIKTLLADGQERSCDITASEAFLPELH